MNLQLTNAYIILYLICNLTSPFLHLRYLQAANTSFYFDLFTIRVNCMENSLDAIYPNDEIVPSQATVNKCLLHFLPSGQYNQAQNLLAVCDIFANSVFCYCFINRLMTATVVIIHRKLCFPNGLPTDRTCYPGENQEGKGLTNNALAVTVTFEASLCTRFNIMVTF